MAVSIVVEDPLIVTSPVTVKFPPTSKLLVISTLFGKPILTVLFVTLVSISLDVPSIDTVSPSAIACVVPLSASKLIVELDNLALAIDPANIPLVTFEAPIERSTLFTLPKLVI